MWDKGVGEKVLQRRIDFLQEILIISLFEKAVIQVKRNFIFVTVRAQRVNSYSLVFLPLRSSPLTLISVIPPQFLNVVKNGPLSFVLVKNSRTRLTIKAGDSL